MTAVVPQTGPVSFHAMKPAEIHPAVKEIALDPAQFHQFLAKESCIEFSDGSHWQLVETPTSWEASDGYVIVAPQANSEQYRIFNLKELTHVEASLKTAPVLDRNTLAIIEIDYLEKTMELTDGLRFQIDGEISEWNENDIMNGILVHKL